MKSNILIHYHEINLKGKNRGWFEKRLQENVISILDKATYNSAHRFAGRLLISLRSDSPSDDILRRLKHVFGIANFSPVCEVPAELEAIRTALSELIRTKTFNSFKIQSRRATKEFPLNSQQLNEELGAFVQNLTKASVRMENPELVCHVEIAAGRAFIYTDKVAGAGGLPSGTGGRVLCLLSGGIDSPVAAYRLMRRGCRVLFIHFHSYPDTTVESQEKVRRIIRILSRYQLRSELHLVPFVELQREIIAYAPQPLRVVLYRRFMVRIAEALAVREKVSALITGDSLGQVASQTLENLRTVSAAASLPIFRPLIGDDKEDIMRTARQIGTYDISILPDQDCCSLFVPRHPETMSSLEQADKAESLLDVPKLVESALSATTREFIEPGFGSEP
jgi:thiamine biosynthesis protein ThiI